MRTAPDSLDSLRCAYAAYVDRYRDASGVLPETMELKLVHTGKVVENAVAIARGEGFAQRTALACEAAALLHDTGRYEQLRRYNTFRDSESVDHAVFSHDIVSAEGWLEGWTDADAVLQAVLVHNRREIPPEIRDPLALACARTVRDADKLDIFRVLETLLSRPGWREDRRAFWNLAIDAPPSQAVSDAIAAGRPVDYAAISCLADFVLVQVGWMANGLEYATSRRLCAERGHLAFRRRFLAELAPSPAIDSLCSMAESRLRQ